MVTQLHNEYAIDLMFLVPIGVMTQHEHRLSQVRVIHEDVCRADEMQIHIRLC